VNKRKENIMGTLFEDIRDGIRDGIELVVDKTEEYTKIGKIQIDILGTKRKIEKLFSELGGRTYELLTGSTKKSVNSDAEVKKLVEELKTLEAELDAKKDEIKVVKDEKSKERQERGESRQKDPKDEADAE
jgi:hypothetical protein